VRLCALVVLAVLWAATSQAQTICETNCEIGQSVPVTMFTEADSTVTRYVLFVNGLQSPVQPRVANGLVDFVYAAGFPRGSYSVVIVAYDASGEVWRTDPNTLTVKPGKRTVKFR
jgi:hypothetical protein